jgi:hypothetical protein
LLHHASDCPFAFILKLLLSVSFICALHIAISHQDASPYLYIMLVALVGVIAILALAFHWNCRLRKVDET